MTTMPTPRSLEEQRRLEEMARRQAVLSQPNWMGNPLVTPQVGPTLGVPTSGQPYTSLPTLGFAPPQLPSVPLLGDAGNAMGRNFAESYYPGKSLGLTAFDAGVKNVSSLGATIAGLGSGKKKGKASAAPTQDNSWDFITGPESGNDPNARNPASTAGGLGQFLDQTWMDKDLRKRAGYSQIADADWARLKVGEAGRAAQIAMTGAYAQRNGEQWQKTMGTPPTNGQTYGMHFLDAGPFILLTQTAATNPGANAAEMFPQAAKANPSIFYKGTATRQPRTAGEVYAELTRRGGDIDPFDMPDLPRLNPGMANAIPMPGAPRHVDLPDPVQMPDMPARPQQEELPAEQWLAQLQQFAPKSFDEKEANKGRFGAVISGIARGAASADPRQGVGAMLAAMGAGGSQVQTLWAQNLKAEKAQVDEASRLFQLALARQGIDFAGQNRQIRQGNREAAWQDQRDKLMTGYTNKANQWEVDTRQYLQNNNIDRQYDSDVLQAKTARARLALSFTEFNAQQAAREVTGQTDLDLQRFLYENRDTAKGVSADVAKNVAAIAASQGIDPAMVYKNKDVRGANALQGFAYIAAGNKPAAIDALGAEVIYSGRFDLLPPERQKEIRAMAQQSPELAAAAAGRLLNEAEADPKLAGTSLNVARVLAGQGAPLATAFMRFAKPNEPKAPAATTGTK